MRSQFLVKILGLFLFSVLFLNVSSQELVKAMRVDYRIEIESGRDPKRPDIRPKPIVYFNSMLLYDGKAVYFSPVEGKEWSSYTNKEKSIFWRKGKTSYKYEYKDTNCCIMYSQLKKRYSTESTVLEEKIAGRRAKKILVFDDVNKIEYLVWADYSIATSISPIGFMPVGGLVMRLRNENVVYEVVKISQTEVAPSFFEVDTEKYRFSEKAFRTGFIE